MKSLHAQYDDDDDDNDDDDDEEETVELRVSASRQNHTRGGDTKRTVLRKMSSSTSSRFAEATSPHGGHDNTLDPPSLSVRRTSAASLLELTKHVLTTGSSHRSYITTDSESLPEAASLLPQFSAYKNAWRNQPPQQEPSQHQQQQQQRQEAYTYEESRVDTAKEAHARLKHLAFWQLLATGFEVLRFSIGKRAKKYVLWLALDGNLYLGGTKNDKKTARCLFLADVYRIQKGNDSQSFTKSQSWRDTRGKDNLTFSIHGRYGKEDRIFAIQVWKPNVRNILVENFESLLRMMKSDADGEFPYVAQRVIAEHYALTGDVLTLRQVEDVLLCEEEEKRPREMGGGGSIVSGGDDSDGDERSSAASGISEEEEDQSDILG